MISGILMTYAAVILTACGGGGGFNGSDNTTGPAIEATAVFSSEADAKSIAQTAVRTVPNLTGWITRLYFEYQVFDFTSGAGLSCSNGSDKVQVSIDSANNFRTQIDFFDCITLSQGSESINETLNGTVTIDESVAGEISFTFSGYNYSDPDVTVDGDILLRFVTQANEQSIDLEITEFSYSSSSLVLSTLSEVFHQALDVYASAALVDLEEQADYTEGAFDVPLSTAFVTSGIYTFITEVPISFDPDVGEYVAGTLIINGANNSYIRVTDSTVAGKADVTVDYDGDGPGNQFAYQWDWSGDLYL